MRLYQKIIVGVGFVALAAFSLGGALVAVGFFDRFYVVAALSALEQDPVARLVSLAIFLFLLGMSVYFPFSFARQAEKKATVGLKNPLGEVEISQKAISEFVQRVGKEVEGVEDLEADIKPSDEGLDVYLTLSAEAKGEIPRLIDELQTVVRNYLTSTIGIENVREIKVKVAKIL
jgi:uncharacterized alkaline shock family protein YloU